MWVVSSSWLDLFGFRIMVILAIIQDEGKRKCLKKNVNIIWVGCKN
jgi:hypothetical protein